MKKSTSFPSLVLAFILGVICTVCIGAATDDSVRRIADTLARIQQSVDKIAGQAKR